MDEGTIMENLILEKDNSKLFEILKRRYTGKFTCKNCKKSFQTFGKHQYDFCSNNCKIKHHALLKAKKNKLLNDKDFLQVKQDLDFIKNKQMATIGYSIRELRKLTEIKNQLIEKYVKIYNKLGLQIYPEVKILRKKETGYVTLGESFLEEIIYQLENRRRTTKHYAILVDDAQYTRFNAENNIDD